MGEFTVGYKTYYGNINPGDNRIAYGSFTMPQKGIPLRGYIKTYLANGAKFKVAIYNSDGTLAAPRAVAFGANSLTFSGTGNFIQSQYL